MAKKKAKLGLSKLSPTDKVQLAVDVVEAMTDNAATFPAPNPSMDDLEAMHEKVTAMLTARNNLRDQLNVAEAELLLALDDLDDGLTRECNYVNNVANGDIIIINKSAMPVSAEPVYGVMPIIPYAITPKALGGGVVSYYFTGDRHAVAYQMQWCTNPMDEDSWSESIPVSRTLNLKIYGLPVGVRIFIRLRAIGHGDNKVTLWSNNASIIVT